MNYKQKITAYFRQGRDTFKYNYGKKTPSTLAAKVFKKKFSHSTFSCYKDLIKFVENIQENIIDKLEYHPNGNYKYNNKLAFLNTIKRCLYARYADNLHKNSNINDKIGNIKELVEKLTPYLNIIYKLSLGITITADERFKLYASSGATIKNAIFNALDHFSIIIALKKLYIIINHLIKNKKRITKIIYLQNSTNPPDIKTFFINNALCTIHHSKGVDYKSALIAQVDENKYSIQLLRLYSSILRIYHSHNFEITYTKDDGNDYKMSTQTDLFKTTYQNDNYKILNNKSVIKEISLQNSYVSPNFKETYNQNVLSQLNYHYKSTNNIGMKEINKRLLYNPIAIPNEDNKIPFYLDIFANKYYKNINSVEQTKKRENKSRIKNKILELLQNYYTGNNITNDTLTCFGLKDTYVINMKGTYFYNKINQYKDTQPLSINIDNYPDENLLTVPISLFIKDVDLPVVVAAVGVTEPGRNSKKRMTSKEQISRETEDINLAAASISGKKTPNSSSGRRANAQSSEILAAASISGKKTPNSSSGRRANAQSSENLAAGSISGKKTPPKPIRLSSQSASASALNGNQTRRRSSTAAATALEVLSPNESVKFLELRKDSVHTSCINTVKKLIKDYLTRTDKILRTNHTEIGIYTQICKNYAGQTIKKTDFIKNLQQYLITKR